MAKKKRVRLGMEDSICRYGADVLTRQLLAMQAEMEGVRAAEDVEFVHRMRVASRRLRTALPLFAACLPLKKSILWQKEIRQITRALGEARDADVHLETLKSFYLSLTDPIDNPGIRRLILRMRQLRARLQRGVLVALDKLEASRTVPDLLARVEPFAAQTGAVPASDALYQLACRAITADLDAMLEYEVYLYQPERVKELHAMRIAAKHLRYSVEIFAPLYPNEMKDTLQVLRKLQTSLGDIHDYDMWMLFLPEFMRKESRRVLKYTGSSAPMRKITPGLAHFLEECQQRRAAEYANLVGDWRVWQEKDLWNGVRLEVQPPEDQSESPAANAQSEE